MHVLYSLSVRFRTPELERTTFASVAYEAVPESIRPSTEIEWPRADPNAVPITTVIPSRRCWYYEFEGPVLVRGGVTNGMASVRVNIPGWNRVDLANPSFAIKIED